MKLITDHMSRNDFSDPFFEFMKLEYGELHIRQDRSTGLFAIIAIHNTSLGPALGGCRFISYPNVQAAVVDALRLAQGMSYKSAISELPFGGGKAVIMMPSHPIDRHALFLSFGRFIHDLGGRYITAEDSGTHVGDMDTIHQITPFVTGNSSQLFLHKNPAPITALGVRRGIQAALQFTRQTDSLQDCHVAILGLGQVGYHLAKECHLQGARLTVFDVNAKAMQRCVDEFDAQTADSQSIDKLDCDIYAPCALSNAVNTGNVEQIKAPIIAGSANNQLQDPHLADVLKSRNILYAPDYVINAGGLIHVAAQYQHLSEQEAFIKVDEIYSRLLAIFRRARDEELSTLAVADQVARKKLHL